MPIALDATYSLGPNLSGVGVYCRRILFGLAAAHTQEQFRFYYRPHRFVRSFQDSLPANASRRLLLGAPREIIFHALNQRVDKPARRTVTTFHDLFVITGDYSSAEFRERFSQQARVAATNSDLIIAVSQFTAGQVESLLNIPAARIRVIPHGVDPAPASNVARENLILSVGAIQKRKNIARLVKAFEHLPPFWRLVLAGAATGYGAAEELQAVENSPRRSSIDVLGYVDQTQLESLYRRASIFAFPSLGEGFGIPVLEAMAHGTPVVTSRSSSLPEVAGDAALLVDPEDTGEIANALLQLASDLTLRAGLAAQGLLRARQFSWDTAVTKTWKVYDELR